MRVSLIVAADENNVIGGGNDLLWHLPADLKHFRELTDGHPIIMGRKTYESIGRALPNRLNIIITRQKGFSAKDCEVVPSLDRAIALAARTEGEEAFVIGGGEIYRLAWPMAHTLYFTRVHDTFKGDITIPAIDETEWQEVSSEHHEADENNPHAFTFHTYKRG